MHLVSFSWIVRFSPLAWLTWKRVKFALSILIKISTYLLDQPLRALATRLFFLDNSCRSMTKILSQFAVLSLNGRKSGGCSKPTFLSFHPYRSYFFHFHCTLGIRVETVLKSEIQRLSSVVNQILIIDFHDACHDLIAFLCWQVYGYFKISFHCRIFEYYFLVEQKLWISCASNLFRDSLSLIA